MNIRMLLWAAMFTAALMTGSVAMAHSVTQVIQQVTQQQVTQTTDPDLASPYILEVSTPPGTRLSAQISMGGTVIHRLNAAHTVIALSPYLVPGTNTLDITGSYQPTTASVQIKLTGPGMTLQQHVGGTGMIDQRFTFSH